MRKVTVYLIGSVLLASLLTGCCGPMWRGCGGGYHHGYYYGGDGYYRR